MYNKRIQYAIDNFIQDDYFLPMQEEYELREKEEEGKSILRVKVDGNNICVEDYDNKGRCSFVKPNSKYGMKKSVDHFLLVEQDTNWDLYMIEMKSSVGDKKWLDIKSKVRSSYLNIKALCVFLGIEMGNVFTYTTYENESFTEIENTADIKTKIPLLGKKATNFKTDEWDKGLMRIIIDEFVELPHTALKMKRNEANELEGELILANK